jgi:hypothetical protein
VAYALLRLQTHFAWFPGRKEEDMRHSLRGLAVLVAGLLGTAGVLLGAPVTYHGTLAQDGTGSPGTGTTQVDIDTVANTLRVQVAFSGLLGTTTAAHIHAPTAAPFTGNAGVATQTPTFSGFPLGVTSGTYDQTFDMTLASTWNGSYVTANGGSVAATEAAFAAALAAGKAYLNIHTSSFGGGEIRAFLPEPATAAAMLLGAGLLFRRRRGGQAERRA